MTSLGSLELRPHHLENLVKCFFRNRTKRNQVALQLGSSVASGSVVAMSSFKFAFTDWREAKAILSSNPVSADVFFRFLGATHAGSCDSDMVEIFLSRSVLGTCCLPFL